MALPVTLPLDGPALAAAVSALDDGLALLEAHVGRGPVCDAARGLLEVLRTRAVDAHLARPAPPAVVAMLGAIDAAARGDVDDDLRDGEG